MDANTWTKRVYFGDVHIPFEDKTALKVLKEFIKDFKPQDVVCLGDMMTADQFSKYPNRTKITFEDECARVRELLSELGVTHFLFGNHEERTERDHLDERMLPTYNLSHKLELDKMGIQWKPYDSIRGIFKFGKLKALHGYCYPENAAMAHARTYGCCVFGHTHRIQRHQARTDGVRNTGYNIGCLCKLDMPYKSKRMPAGWAQGFMFAYHHKNGGFTPTMVGLIGNEWILNRNEYSRR